MFSQEKDGVIGYDSFDREVKELGSIILKNGNDINFNKWYEGKDLVNVKLFFKTLSNDLEHSKNGVSIMIQPLSKDPLLYTMLFYEKVTDKDLGQLFIGFINRENLLIDDIKFISKKDKEKINFGVNSKKKDNLKTNTPPPPPPLNGHDSD